MAFGKDNSRLDGIPGHGGSFTQRARQAGKRPQRKGGGGGAFYWKGTYKPPEAPPGDIVRFLRGDYLQSITYDGETVVQEKFDYFAYREHHNGDRGCICSAGPLFGSKGKSEPCPSCDVFWEDVAERKRKKASGDRSQVVKRMNTTERFAVLIWDYGTYIEVPELNSDGSPRVSTQSGQPFMQWVKGDPRQPQFAGRQWKYGHLLPYSMSKFGWDVVLDEAKLIGLMCASCHNRQGIVCQAKVCRFCKHPVYYPDQSGLTLEQQKNIDENPHTCANCKNIGFVDEIIYCQSCQTPKRTSLFDVDVQIFQTVSSSDSKQRTLRFTTFSEPRPLQVSPEVWAAQKPIDLAQKFAPTPPETQYKIMNLTPKAPPQQQMQLPGMVPGMPAGPAVQPPMMPAMGQMMPGMYGGVMAPPMGQQPMQNTNSMLMQQQPMMAPPAMGQQFQQPQQFPQQLQPPQAQQPQQTQPALPSWFQPSQGFPAVPYNNGDQGSGQQGQ